LYKTIIAQGPFYSGAWCILEVPNELAKEGDVEELQRVLRALDYRHRRCV
jgi:hypothetical protein